MKIVDMATRIGGILSSTFRFLHALQNFGLGMISMSTSE